MTSIYQGCETQATVMDGLITKTTWRTFPDKDEAHGYIASAQLYETGLRDVGFMMPQTIGFETVKDGASDQYKVVHVAEFIKGPNLADITDSEDDRLAAHQHAVMTIAQCSVGPRGNLSLPIDAVPENFVKPQDSTQAFLIDILPPLVSATDQGPSYRYVKLSDSVVAKRWADRYFASRTGVLTRFVCKTLTLQASTLHLLDRQQTAAKVEELFQTSQDLPHVEETMESVKHGVIPFLGFTLLNRLNQTAKGYKKL